MTTAGPALDLKSLKFVPLPSPSALADFRCGEDAIDREIAKCCVWESRNRARVFCAYLPADPIPRGFYCPGLHAHEAKAVHGFFAHAREDFRNYVPFIYLDYIGVRQELRRNGIGTVLLLHALERCTIVIRNVGSYGVALHALNDVAAKLYDRYGFRPVDEKAKTPFMVLPAQSVLDLFPLRKPVS
jgi:GNAT superfamily N-acetyltransferase